jgi:hypothetical protein
MPAVKEERREPLLNGSLRPEEKGDFCFLEYQPLMDAWRKEQRWTTVHNQFKRLFGTDDIQTAKILAFAEFYIRHVHEYENRKFAENGQIEGRA